MTSEEKNLLQEKLRDINLSMIEAEAIRQQLNGDKDKLTLKQIKKKFKISDDANDVILNIIKINKNISANQISQTIGVSVANISGFLKSQGIKIKRY